MKVIKEIFILIWILLLVVLFILGISKVVHSSESLSLKFGIDIQLQDKDPEGDSWRSVSKLTMDGIGGLQYHLSGGSVYRLVLSVDKPYDLSGTLKFRSNNRTDGITLARNTTTAQMIFGPQKGCTVRESRCRPLDLDDVGQFQIQMNIEKAVVTSFGIFFLRPHSEPSPIEVRPTLFHDGEQINCGDVVKKGWWLFAKKLRVQTDPAQTISICVQTPDKEVNCANDEVSEIKIKTSQKGKYRFFSWNDGMILSMCEVVSEKME